MNQSSTSRRIPLVKRQWDSNEFALFTKEPHTYLAFNMDAQVAAHIAKLHNEHLARESFVSDAK